MTNLSVSENSQKNLLNISSTTLFQLIEGPQKITYLPLMRSMVEIQFLLSVHFILPVVFLPPQRSALFQTRLSTVPQLYLLYLSIFPKKKKLNREVDITGLLEVTVKGSCITEIYASREDFGCARYVIGSTRMCTNVEKFIVIVCKRIMTPSFVSLDMFQA